MGVLLFGICKRIFFASPIQIIGNLMAMQEQ